MTILWIYYCPLIPEAGGTERMTALIAKGLTQDGHNCLGMMVITKTGEISYNDTKVEDVYDFLCRNKVDIVINQLATDAWLLEIFLQKGGDKWRKEGGKIISCLHFDPQKTSSLYYFRAKQEKTLADYYWIMRSWLLYKHYEKIQDKNTGEIYRRIYNNSDWFVILSESFNPYLKKVTELPNYSKLVTINNPLTFDTIADKSTLDKKRKVILVCSRMDEYQKRISLVLKAWRQLLKSKKTKDWELKIVGSGPDLERYKEYACKHKLKRITFEGRQNPEPYYDEASIFLMTSGFEGWGLTLTESLQKGVVPVVMNTCPVYSDIIDHCYNGYLTKGSDIGDFVRHIKSLISDERRLRAMQSNALESASRFTLAKTMEKWKQILQPSHGVSTDKNKGNMGKIAE